MTKIAEFANTPVYVLKSGAQPIYPTVLSDDSGLNCICVYGFSEKLIYDQFVKNASQALTPYPLVKGYLANRIAEAKVAEADGVYPTLVILDATDPSQPCLSAAKMTSVLRSQEEKAKQVPIEYELVFDSETTSYQFKNDLTTVTA